jgi:hypothetical protein
VEIDPSLQLTWAIAHAEARLSGSQYIEPIHFLLAILKIVDEAFYQDAEQLRMSAGTISQLKQMAAEGRRMLGLPEDEITRIRRSIWRSLRSGTPRPSVLPLHRSLITKGLFN